MYVLRWIKTLTLMKGRDRSIFLELVKRALSSDNAHKAKMKSAKAGIVIIIITPRRVGEKRKQSRNACKVLFSLLYHLFLLIICGCF